MIPKISTRGNSKSPFSFYVSQWVSETFFLPTESASDWSHQCRPLQIKNQQTSEIAEARPSVKWGRNRLQKDRRKAVTIFDNYNLHKETLISVQADVLDISDDHLALISKAQHHIKPPFDITNPVHSALYYTVPKYLQSAAKRIAKVLKQDAIESAAIDWASLIVFAAKKGESLRFCFNDRMLNAVTDRDSYLIPRMDGFIDSLGEAVFISTLDASNGYWPIKIYPRDCKQTLFTVHYGLNAIECHLDSILPSPLFRVPWISSSQQSNRSLP